jgi:hypothetical protein
VIRNPIHHKIYIEVDNQFLQSENLKFHPINLLFDTIVDAVREQCPSTSPSDIQNSDDYDTSFEFSVHGHLYLF